MASSTKPTKTTSLDKIALVKEKFAQGLWNERRFEFAEELFTDDFYTESMAFRSSDWIAMHGKGATSMVHHIKWWLTILPDAQLTIQDIVVTGDTLIETWQLSGTMQGELLGYAPNHQLLQIKGSTVAIFEGSKIKKHKTLLDAHGLLLQIGALEN